MKAQQTLFSMTDPSPLVGESDRIKTLGAQSILTERDLRDLGAACIRVYLLMKDGAWHGADKIRMAAGKNGQPASEGLRRMRELRKFFNIGRRRVHDTRLFEYRLTKRGELF